MTIPSTASWYDGARPGIGLMTPTGRIEVFANMVMTWGSAAVTISVGTASELGAFVSRDLMYEKLTSVGFGRSAFDYPRSVSVGTVVDGLPVDTPLFVSIELKNVPAEGLIAGDVTVRFAQVSAGAVL